MGAVTTVSLADVEPIELPQGSWSRMLVTDARVGGNASSLGFGGSLVYGVGCIRTAVTYRLARWDFKRRLRLEANDHYWDRARVRSRSVEMCVVADALTGLRRYEFGKVDWLVDIPSEIGADLMTQKRPDMPLILCEYTHAMGNSNGGLKEYWDVFYSGSNAQGAFVWDWIDQGIRQDVPEQYRPAAARKASFMAYGGYWEDRGYEWYAGI